MTARSHTRTRRKERKRRKRAEYLSKLRREAAGAHKTPRRQRGGKS